MLVNQMNEMAEVIELLKKIMNNPWLLAFLALFLIGWLLKEHSNLPNQLIPWVLTITGGGLGILLIEGSLAGTIMGCSLAYIEMALYEKIKHTVAYFVEKNQMIT